MKSVVAILIALALQASAETTTPDSGTAEALDSFDVTAYGINANCRNFLQSDGSLGPWGLEIVAAFERVGTDCFYRDADFSLLCPGFSNFTRQRKTQFMAFFYAALAEDESTCNPDEEAQGTNDRAMGLFQLEDSQAQRADADRHELCSPHAPVANTKDLTYQMRCAAGIFSDYHCRRDDYRYVRVGNGGPFQELRGPDQEVSEMVKKFPGCN